MYFGDLVTYLQIIQRQILKEDLSNNVVDERNTQSGFDSAELKRIFEFKTDEKCLIYPEKENDKKIVFREVSQFSNLYAIFT